MEIGYPTELKHVAHIGWDSAAGNASPTWMNNIMAAPDFSSLGNFAASTGTTSWASQASVLVPPSRICNRRAHVSKEKKSGFIRFLKSSELPAASLDCWW